MVEIEPKKAVKRRHRRHHSPPVLPPRWGEGVAPPPTPQYATPHVSPEASEGSSQRPHRRRYLQRHSSSTVHKSQNAKLVGMIPKRAKHTNNLRQSLTSILRLSEEAAFLRLFLAKGNCISTFYTQPFVCIEGSAK